MTVYSVFSHIRLPLYYTNHILTNIQKFFLVYQVNYDINKIEERLDAGTYDIYTCNKAIFILVKRSKDYIM